MEKFQSALDKLGDDMHDVISELRADMRREFDSVHGTITHLQEAMSLVQEGMIRQQQALSRQAHVLDQGLARMDDTFRIHRENVGTAVFTFVEDLNALKTDMRDVRARVESLERRTPPAA